MISVQSYLIDKLDVHPENITRLLSPIPGRNYEPQLPGGYLEPTYDNIITALKMRESFNKGDFIYVHFSGHGARSTTIFEGVKDTAFDEALVPSDFSRGGHFLRDLELGILLQEMDDAGLIVTVVLDCCHSGGAVRGDNSVLGEARGISQVYQTDQSERNYQPKFDLMQKISRNISPWQFTPHGVLVLAACQENEVARETIEGNRKHGLLTFELVKILNASPLDLSLQAIYGKVRFNVQNRNRDQQPHFVGRQYRSLFSDTVQSHVHELRVTKVFTELWRAEHDRYVELQGGSLHGVSIGSEYIVLPHDFDLGQPHNATDVLARVRIEGVWTGRCTVSFKNRSEVPWEAIKEGCPCIPLKKFTVGFVSSDDTVQERFRQDWSQHNGDNAWLWLEEDRNSDVFFMVSIDDSGAFEIRARDESGLRQIIAPNTLVRLSASATTRDRNFPELIYRLRHLARFTMTRDLVSSPRQPDTPFLVCPRSVTVSAAPEAVDYGGRTIFPACISRIESPSMPTVYKLEEMTLFRFTVKNYSSRTVGCVVLDCASDCSIERVFPPDEPFHSLEPGEEKDIDLVTTIPSDQVESARSDTPTAIVDTFKVFMCYPRTVIDSLALPGLLSQDRTGPTQIELNELLINLDSARLAFSPRATAVDWWVIEDVKVWIMPGPQTSTC